MIPYFTFPVYQLGPVPIDPWGFLVCVGFVLGLELARARGIALGLDVRDIVDGAVFIVLTGFVGAHLMFVLGYHYDRFERDGVMALLRVWEGFASSGGFLGAVVGAVVFYTLLRPRAFLLHVDTIMYGVPFAWIFGRAGCFLVHDHPGARSDFFLAVKFPGGARHDLGLYETLVSVGVAAVFLAVSRFGRPVTPGTFVAVWCLLYAPARFGMDFLRATDVALADPRYSGLTPAQYVCIGLFAVGAALLAYTRSRPAAPVEPVTPS